MIRGFPNRETVQGFTLKSTRKVAAVRWLDSAMKTTQGSETSQYLEEKKSKRFP